MQECLILFQSLMYNLQRFDINIYPLFDWGYIAAIAKRGQFTIILFVWIIVDKRNKFFLPTSAMIDWLIGSFLFPTFTLIDRAKRDLNFRSRIWYFAYLPIMITANYDFLHEYSLFLGHSLFLYTVSTILILTP